MHVIAATNVRFAMAARAALLNARFSPARVAGCPVKESVQQDVRFRTQPR